MANNFGQKEAGLLLIIFIGAIITIAFISQIGTDISRQTSQISSINETLDITASQNGTDGIDGVDASGAELSVVNDRDATGNFPISGFSMRNNNTGATIDAANYTVDLVQGNLTLLPNDYWNNTPQNGIANVLVDYTYKHADFVDDSGSRNIISLILIFAALAILIFVIVILFTPGSSFNRLLRGGDL